MDSTTSFMSWSDSKPREYHPPFLHRWRHLATILPNQLRPIRFEFDERLTFETPDGDFFHIDHAKHDPKRIAIVMHGLEGESRSNHILGMAKALSIHGWSILAPNHRSCGDIPNRLVTSYHSGFTQDLRQLIDGLDTDFSVVVIGFSLGGNIALKYAGETAPPPQVKCVVAISVPVHLSSSGVVLAKWYNIIYRIRFMRKLRKKTIAKCQTFPDAGLDEHAIRSSKYFKEFDNAYTAPVHGFKDAEDYYERSSALQFLSQIQTPTLLINAQNDSFLSSQCFPDVEAASNPNIHYLKPRFGGHVGFATDNAMKKEFWHERQVIDFIQTFAP